MNQVEMIDNKLMYEQVDKRKKWRFINANDGVRYIRKVDLGVEGCYGLDTAGGVDEVRRCHYFPARR
jgi:hypothetical protein